MQSTPETTSQGTAMEQDDDLFYEVVDEKVVEIAPMGAHEVWLASVLILQLGAFVSQHQLGQVVPEMLFDLGPTVRRKRRPDVAFVSYERWPRQRRVPRAEAWEVIPNLAIEVVSRSDKGDDIVDKVTEYFRAGVESVWVVFPSQEQLYIYESPISVRILTRADELRGEPILPHFRFPLTLLFDDMAETEQPQ